MASSARFHSRTWRSLRCRRSPRELQRPYVGSLSLKTGLEAEMILPQASFTTPAAQSFDCSASVKESQEHLYAPLYAPDLLWRTLHGALFPLDLQPTTLPYLQKSVGKALKCTNQCCVDGRGWSVMCDPVFSIEPLCIATVFLGKIMEKQFISLRRKRVSLTFVKQKAI